MLTGQNGILNRAAEAKEKTGIAHTEEEIKLSVMAALTEGTGKLTVGNLKTELARYGIKTDPEEETSFPVTVNAGGKKYTIDEYGNITEGKGTTAKVPEGLKVGSEVTYSPEGTYNWQGKYCSSDTTKEDTQLSSKKDGDFNLTKWKVLSIENGKVELVPTAPTTGKVYLGEAQGYNNGVKLLNDACSSLYGNTKKGITARSLNIEDIEKYMLEDKLAEAHTYSNAAKYNEQVSSAYTSNKNYPIIYGKEKLSVIDGTKKEKGLNLSEQQEFIEATEDGATGGKISAATSIQPYQTYWYKDSTYMQGAFRTATSGTNYYDLIMPKGTSTTYWLASRCIFTYSSYCDFNMHCVYSGGMNAYYVDNSGDNAHGDSFALFPVVSLSSELLEGSTEAGFTVKAN